MPDTAETVFLNTIFSVALEKKATDIHLMAGNYPVFRIGDSLHMLADQKVLNVSTLHTLADTMLSEEQKKHLTEEKEVRTVYTWANRARFRASIYHQQGYPAFSFRLIPSEIPDPVQLQIPDTIVERSQRRQGIILICGPFNSGRTTTMLSLLQHINQTSSKRILTLEKPVEYLMINSKSLVNQREVGIDTPSFDQGILDAIDADVDVVGISQMFEDKEHELILTLAESGKMVVAVSNSTSTISALEKFVNSVASEKRQWAKDALSTMLLGVVNQRLVPAIGGGRVLAYGVLTMTPAVAATIQDEHYTQLATVMQTSREDGMVSLDAKLYELVRAGKISSEDAKKFANDPNLIRS